jgi:hypothetical protein
MDVSNLLNETSSSTENTTQETTTEAVAAVGQLTESACESGKNGREKSLQSTLERSDQGKNVSKNAVDKTSDQGIQLKESAKDAGHKAEYFLAEFTNFGQNTVLNEAKKSVDSIVNVQQLSLENITDFAHQSITEVGQFSLKYSPYQSNDERSA